LVYLLRFDKRQMCARDLTNQMANNRGKKKHSNRNYLKVV